MGSFMDEQIVSMLNEAEKAADRKDITQGPVKIGSRYYAFKETAFWDGRVTLLIPEDFDDMPPHLSKIKYPHEQRPQIIKTDETGCINVTLSRIDQELEEEWVQELAEGMKAILRKANPASVFYTEGVEEVEGKQIAYFDFKSPAIDDPIYNVMFYFMLEGTTVMGTFCCLYKDYAAWRPIVLQMIQSIRVLEQPEGEGDQ
ncbi:hypothetical protein [Paenibacillus xylaniclasticus]|uniref:hypothetical protein n=1 Tax=Paenibacillus xylaniclasticus TaxID=588083 RepID=UPI000FD996C6|nr:MULTISPECIES: hypothetical protein [Paenibacillus]GFN32142.1 hypothetical protein PCURB6_24020 [Paenibacillus curdlanolyticus]